MDHHDLHSPEQQDLLGRASSIPDSSGANAGFEKQLRDSDLDIKGCKVAKLPEIEIKCLSSGNSSTTCTKEDANDMKKTSSLVTTSGDSVIINQSCSGGALMVMSPCKMPVNERNADGNAFSQAPEGVDSTQNTSMRSESSSESGEDLRKQNTELVNGRMTNCFLKNGRGRLKCMVQDNCHAKQHKTESSSSNSTNVIFPASPNDSCQDISADARSSKCHSAGADTSTNNNLKCCVDESGGKSSVLGLATQISPGHGSDNIFLPWKHGNVENASEVVDNVGARSHNSKLVMIADCKPVIVEVDSFLKSNPPTLENAIPGNHDKGECSSELDDALEVAQRVAREVEQERASGNSCVLGRSSGTLHQNCADSTVPYKEICVGESGCRTPFYIGGSNCDKEVIDREIPLGKKPLYFNIIEPSHDFGLKVAPEANHKQQSTLIMKSEDLVDKDGTISTSDFDLNEDVAMEAECTELLVKETVSHNMHGVFKPKPVMSESGNLVSLPVVQLHDIGGWRGPAATSAFRLTSVSESFGNIKTSSAANNHNNSKDSCIKGIDLNIASAGVDFDMDLLPGKCIPASSSLPPKEASSRQAERFSIDLNCANENEDNFHQMNPPASLRRLPIRDFDLNDNPTLEDTLADAHKPSQGTLTLRNSAVSFLGNPRQQESNNLGSEFWADPSPMQVFRHVHAQPFLVAVPNMLPYSEQMQGIVPVQDKSSYKPTLPPPQSPLSWPNPNGFCIDPSNHFSPAVYSSGIIPCVTEQNGPTVFPQILGSSTHPAFSGASQFTQIPGGLGPNSLATIRPCFGPKNRVTLENRSQEERGGQQFIPVSNSVMEDQIRPFQSVTFSGTAVKRREPEGGWDSHQHGYRQVTYWH
ncbi:hypothetical protein SLA2020_074760 [Shorea laevis]